MPTKAELEAKLAERDEHIADLQKRLRQAEARGDQEAAQYARLVTEYNGLLDMLRDLFHFHDYAKSYDEQDEPLYVVEDKDTGEVLGHPAKDWEAYKEAVRERIKGLNT